MTNETRLTVREVVSLAVRYWPNAHLGAVSRREDIRSAFFRIRRDIAKGLRLSEALYRLERDAFAHSDM